MSPYAMTRPRGMESTTSSTRWANSGMSADSTAELSDRLWRHVGPESRSQPAGERRRVGHLQHEPAELRTGVALDPQQQLRPPHVPEAAIVAEAERAGDENAGHCDARKVEADLRQPITRLDDNPANMIGRNLQRAPKGDQHVEPAHPHDEVVVDDIDLNGWSQRIHPSIVGRRPAAANTACPI